MLKTKNILVPTDFSTCAHQALSQAIDLAKRSGARLHVLHVMSQLEGDVYSPLRYTPEAAVLHESVDTSVHELLEEAIAPFDTRGLHIELVARRSMSVTATVLHYVEQKQIDLIVLGTHKYSGMQRMFRHSATGDIARRAPCGVLTVREQKEPTAPLSMKRVLVPVDFSEFSEVALHQAYTLAVQFGATLDVLHVIEPFAFPVSLTGIKTIYDVTPDFQEKATTHLEEMLEHINGPTDMVRLHIMDGHPAGVIIDFAQRFDIDLIVIATRGLGGLDRFLLGSVTERVVRMASCPIYTVKTARLEDINPATETLEAMAQ